MPFLRLMMTEEKQAEPGQTVKVHYTGKLTDGQVFDSSRERGEPLEFTLGQGQIIPGFEKAVVGMRVGETKVSTFPPEEAYGPANPELKIQFPREQFPNDITPEVGLQLYMTQANGQPAPVTIAEVDEKSIVLDANHPLAGKDLTFEIELVEVA